MSVKWLSYQSFQYSQQLISALNAILIDLKLRESGNLSGEHSLKVIKAFSEVDAFLEAFDSVVSRAEQPDGGPALGTSMRMRQLGTRYIKARRSTRKFRSDLLARSINDFRDALRAAEVDDRHALIAGLEDMRSLIEEHFNEDISEVIGEN